MSEPLVDGHRVGIELSAKLAERGVTHQVIHGLDHEGGTHKGSVPHVMGHLGEHRRPSPGRLLVAALLAGGLSGVPSTVHALSTQRSPLAAARAAGELLGRPGLARGLVAHALITLWWTAVLAAVAPRGAGAGAAALRGAVGGAAIAALDLTIARRRFPAIAALPIGGQVADHVVFGAVVGAVLQWGSDRRSATATTTS